MVPLGTPASLCRLITTPAMGSQTGKILNSATLEQNEQQTQNHQHTASSNPPQPSQSQPNPGTANPIGLPLVDDVRFTDFNISDSLKSRLTNAGFTTPTPVQAKAIPPALEGNDILATASTGTGKTLALDEVDRMLDMGFLPATRRIVGAVPKTRQTMCYSATLDANIREIVRDYVNKPVRVEIGQTSKPSDQVELRVYTVMQDQKLGLLDQMLRQEEGTFLVFSRTKHGADRISKKLERLCPDAHVIHGHLRQLQPPPCP